MKPTQHHHYVGPTTLAKMAELDDEPNLTASCEVYPLNNPDITDAVLRAQVRGEISWAVGRSGMLYMYVRDLNKTVVMPTTDWVLQAIMAGGDPR